MSNSTRLVQVSNDNPLIMYEPVGAWTVVPKTNEMFLAGTLGFPMSPSLETTTNGLFVFTFDGSYVEAAISFILNDEEPALNVDCTVDGNALTTVIPQLSENNWPLCSSGNLPAGEHTFILDIQSQGTSFFFDYLLYEPSSPIIPDDVFLRIDASDPSINYSGAFMSESDTGSAWLTNAFGASINVSFTGQQLTWYGAYSSFLPSSPSSAEYSIDGTAFKQFSLSGLINGPETAALLNQVLFQTEALPLGSHQLTVRYLGNGQQTALSLAFMNIESSIFVEPTFTVGHITPEPTSNDSSSSATSSQTSSSQLPPSSSSSVTTSANLNITSSTLSTSSSTTSIISTASTSSSLSSSSSTVSQTTQTDPAKPHNDRGILIEALVGGGAFIFLIIIMAFYLRKRYKRRVLEAKPKIKEQLDMSTTPQADIRLSYAFGAEAPTLPSDLQRGRTMRTMKTTTSDSLDGWIGPNNSNDSNNPSIRSAAWASSQADSTEALIPQVRSLFTSAFEDERWPVIVENDRRDSQIAYVEILNTSPAPSPSIRPLPTPPIPAQQRANVRSARLEMPVPPPMAVVEERHEDSGVRFGRQTLLYGAKSFQSLKGRLPPTYTRS